jgi:hypothetical protein
MIAPPHQTCRIKCLRDLTRSKAIKTDNVAAQKHGERGERMPERNAAFSRQASDSSICSLVRSRARARARCGVFARSAALMDI